MLEDCITGLEYLIDWPMVVMLKVLGTKTELLVSNSVDKSISHRRIIYSLKK